MRNRARELRKRQTEAEKLLWQNPRNRQLEGFKFRRQELIGTYIVDFICIDSRLIIEVDGGQHTDQREYDQTRTDCLTSPGFHVIRFWNNKVLNNTEAVLESIRNSLVTSPHPGLLPEGEGD